MANFHEILKKYWGFDDFRTLQEDIIKSVYNKNDTLALMPTGGGKSITFQVPALAFDGICIVVTPLIALMKDQVDNLKARGIKALAVYSGMNRQEIQTAYDNAIYGNYKFLYISPERLQTELFYKKVQEMNVSMLVVDEAHCISQWGYDFRPSYLKISKIKEFLQQEVTILALTATATKNVVEDIQAQLKFKKENVFAKSFHRQNLIYAIKKSTSKEKDLLSIISKVAGSGLIYVRNRSRTKEISDFLINQNISADFFHAGLSPYDKIRKQEAWKNNEIRIMVCTNAFGMGIDKPDVRLVVHYDLSNSLEEYFQEAGRAGRDDEKAYALILYQNTDIAMLEKRVKDEFPTKDFIKSVYENLAYFYQVPIGERVLGYKKFNIFEFAKQYKMTVAQIHNALKILNLAGYIDYQDETENKAKIMILATKAELYDFNLTEEASKVLNYLLRNYSGLFSQYTVIDEQKLVAEQNIKERDLKDIFNALSKRGIISYIPKRKDPVISYTVSRVEKRHLNIPKEVYQYRQERFSERIEKMVDYVEQNEKCRVKYLLNYFDENKKEDCDKCDICKQKKESKDLRQDIVNAIEKRIITYLEQQNEADLDEIIKNHHDLEEKHIIYTLRQMMDKNKVEYKNFCFNLKNN